MVRVYTLCTRLGPCACSWYSRVATAGLLSSSRETSPQHTGAKDTLRYLSEGLSF